MKCLIVENDSTTCELLQGYLASCGDCTVAVDGPQAVEKVRHAIDNKRSYDLICLDIMIPEMDGYDVLRKIRQIEKEQKKNKAGCSKVIVVTALSDFNNIANAFRAGCQGYLIKPVRKDKLFEQMKKLGLLSLSGQN